MRVTIKDAVKTNFVFVIALSEEWKVTKGIQTMKNGSLAKSCGVVTMSAVEAQRLVGLLGW